MTDVFEIHAEERQDVGKGASRRLRREENLVPAILYGANKKPLNLTLDHNKVLKALENPAFMSHILDLKVGDKTEKVVLKDLQAHPYKRRVMHMDFQRISKKNKLHMNVPLQFVGEEKAPGVKQGGTISHEIVEVEITCLPENLPEFLEADLTKLGLDEALHLSDLTLPKGVEIVALSHNNDLAVATIHKTRAQLVDDAPVTEASPEGDEADKKTD